MNMAIHRLPWPDPDIEALDHALRKWLYPYSLNSSTERDHELRKLSEGLLIEGWLWPDQDNLPLPRWQWTALMSHVVGHIGLAVDIPGAILQASSTDVGSPNRSLVALSACAWVSGAARALVDTTVSYVGIRRQFGQTIGQFQVVQHRAVDMHSDTEALHALMWTVASLPIEPEPIEALDALVDVCWRYWRKVSQSAVQLHGAIAMTNDLPVGKVVLHGESILAQYAQPVDRVGRRVTSIFEE